MLIYLIKSGLCLLVLFSFYKLFLENEQFHGIKRIYLLGAILISFCLPFITITYGVEYVDSSNYNNEALIYNNVNSERASDNASNYLFYILLGLYFTGFSFFAFRFGRNLNLLVKEAKENEHLKKLSYIFVLVGRAITPHSFFNYIFLSKSEYQDKRISSAVIEHEKAHVDQKHSLDILLVELLHLIFWFNPLFIWIKNSIKLNHEFLADKEVLSKKFNVLEYSNILFNYSSGYHHNSLSSPINHSLIKKRIIMITKSFSLRRLLLRSFVFLPVLGGCVYLFNEEIVAKPVLVNTEIVSAVSENIQQQDPTIKIKVEGEKIFLNGQSVSLDDFSSAIDKLTKDWSREELENPGILMRTKDENKGFIEKLNKEFSKTRLSEVSGHGILPPPPPMPPSVGEAPPAPYYRNDSIKILVKTERDRGRKALVEKRQILLEDRRRIREEKMALNKRKNERIKKRKLKMKTERIELERMPPEPPMPPAPPNPIEEIERIEKAGGSFYYNEKKISASQARKIILEKENINIRVFGKANKTVKMEKMELNDI